MPIALTSAQIDSFHTDGFVVVEDVLDAATIAAARARFEPLFAGTFETGLQPDEWNWRTGISPPDVTRQICNGWKADAVIAAIVTRPDIGEACARLRDWPGARLNQDNVIWKPPGARALGFHQDDSYQDWIVPAEMMTCWMTLDDTSAAGGTIEYVRGSHQWPLSPPIAQFHAPDDPLADMDRAADHAGVADPEITAIEVNAGSAVIHHGRTWHGSRENSGVTPRRSVVAHCMSSTATVSRNECESGLLAVQTPGDGGDGRKFLSGALAGKTTGRRGTADMPGVKPSVLPDDALLQVYAKKEGCYTDCYSTEVGAAVTLSQFVTSFYTTPLFKLERFVLRVATSRPSTDAQARALAEGQTDSFTAWTVEQRTDTQLLMCDMSGRTRSWFMVEAVSGASEPKTRLYFGSAVVSQVDRTKGEPKLGLVFTALLGFHKVYSRALLSVAKSRLSGLGPN